MPLTINRNSLHYKLALYGMDCLEYNHCTDTCEYTKALFLGIAKFLIKWISLIFLAIFGTFLFVGIPMFSLLSLSWCALYNPGWCEIKNVSEGIEIGLAFITMYLIAGLIGLYFSKIHPVIEDYLWKRKYRIHRQDTVKEKREPHILVGLYRSWKDKYCAKIEIED